MEKMNLTSWYKDVKEAFSELLGDKELAERLLQYELIVQIQKRILLYLDNESRINLKGDPVILRQIASEILKSLDDELNETWFLDAYGKSNDYLDCMEEYRIENAPMKPNTSSFWIGLAMKADRDGLEAQMALSEKLMPYFIWFDTYIEQFLRQYQPIALHSYVLNERVMMPVPSYQALSELREDDLSGKYAYRENVYMELIRHGYDISEAIKVAHHLRAGKSDGMDAVCEGLKEHGFDELEIYYLRNAHYIPSKSHYLMKVMTIQGLVEADEAE